MEGLGCPCAEPKILHHLLPCGHKLCERCLLKADDLSSCPACHCRLIGTELRVKALESALAVQSGDPTKMVERRMHLDREWHFAVAKKIADKRKAQEIDDWFLSFTAFAFWGLIALILVLRILYADTEHFQLLLLVVDFIVGFMWMCARLEVRF